MVTQLKAPQDVSRKRKLDHTDQDTDSAKRASGYSNSLPSAQSETSGTIELWRDGEKAWKDGTLDYDYLRSNPDKITRVSIMNNPFRCINFWLC